MKSQCHFDIAFQIYFDKLILSLSLSLLSRMFALALSLSLCYSSKLAISRSNGECRSSQRYFQILKLVPTHRCIRTHTDPSYNVIIPNQLALHYTDVRKRDPVGLREGFVYESKLRLYHRLIWYRAIPHLYLSNNL